MTAFMVGGGLMRLLVRSGWVVEKIWKGMGWPCDLCGLR
jgi:hypothetical protein